MSFEQWTETKLGKLFSKRVERGKDGLPVTSVTMHEGLKNRDSLDRKMETNLTPYEHLLVKKGDIVYNTMRMWQGVSGLAEKDCLVSPAYVVCKPNKEIDPLFASYLFKLPRMIKRFESFSYGLTADRLRLYYKDFSQVPVSIPPIKQQKKIAELLTCWDRAISINENILSSALKLKRATIDKYFTDTKETKPYSFSDLFVVANEKKKQIKSDSYLSKGKYPIVDQGKSMVAGYYNDSKNLVTNVPIIIFGDHTREIKLIRFPFVPGADGTQIIKSQPNVQIEVAYYCLLGFRQPSLGYSRHFKAVKEGVFFLPISEGLLEKAVTTLISIDSYIEIQTKMITMFREQKHGLMQQLLAGKIRVKV